MPLGGRRAGPSRTRAMRDRGSAPRTAGPRELYPRRRIVSGPVSPASSLYASLDS